MEFVFSGRPIFNRLAIAPALTRAAISKIEANNRVISDIEFLIAIQQLLSIPYGVIGFIPIDVFQYT